MNSSPLLEKSATALPFGVFLASVCIYPGKLRMPGLEYATPLA